VLVHAYFKCTPGCLSVSVLSRNPGRVSEPIGTVSTDGVGNGLIGEGVL
jgi:hypothetical protein